MVEILTKPLGNLTWDGIVRGSGLLSLIAVPLVLLLPATGPPVGFILMTMWLNGPIAPLLPATYELTLVPLGRFYPPLGIAVVGMLAILYVEYLNYRLYGAAVGTRALRPVRESRAFGLAVRLFNAAPFFAIWLCAWSPLPYWAVRVVAPTTGYPLRRYLLATSIGRLPRLWVFAALGTWTNVSTTALVLIALALILLMAAIFAVKAFRVLTTTAIGPL